MKRMFSLAVMAILILVSAPLFPTAAGEETAYIKNLRQYAAKGDEASQFALGFSYLEGKSGLPVDPVEAVKWFRMSAETGYPLAQHRLGEAYEKGNGVPRDYVEAANWYRRAAAQQYSWAKRSLAVYEAPGAPGDPLAGKWQGFLDRSDGNGAIMVVELKYQKNAYAGQIMLNSLFAEVIGCSYDQGKRRLELQAMLPVDENHKSRMAIHMEGDLVYDRWEGVFELIDLDKKEHENMRFRLARNKIAFAEMHNGEGEYLRYLKKKIADGDVMAMYNLGDTYLDGAFGVPEDRALARQWWERSAEGGFVPAMFRIGFDSFHNADSLKPSETMNLTADELRASGIAWFEKAAAQGDPRALRELEAIRQKNVKVDTGKKTDGRNLETIRNAAKAGKAAMQLAMGLMYENGSDGLARDPVEAVKWYRLAAEQGLPAAQYAFGHACENGVGVSKDEANAIRWYRRAAAQGDNASIQSLKRHEMPGGPADPLLGQWSGTVRPWGGEQEYPLDVEVRLDGESYSGRVVLDFEPEFISADIARCGINLVDRRGILETEARVEPGGTGSIVIRLEGNVGYDRWTGELTLFDPAEKGWTGLTVFSLARSDDAWADLKAGMGEYARKLHAKAEKGDMYAMFSLGMLFLQGQYTMPKSFDTALGWFVRSAEAGCPEAMCRLGLLYFEGTDVVKDRDKGLAWLQKAAEAGDEVARRSLDAIRAKEVGTGEPGTDAGKDVVAILQAVPGEPAEVGQLREKARAGDLPSVQRLGRLYLDGEAIPPDPVKGIALIERAASGGLASAQLDYGLCLMNGILGKADPEAGEKWVRRAAEQGDVIAGGVIGVLTFSRWREGDDPAEKDRAVEWVRRGAKANDANAQYFLGTMYLEGKFIPANPTLATLWFQRAARLGYVDARHQAGICYLDGIGVVPDPGRAKRWLIEAKAAGDDRANAALERIPADVVAKADIPVVRDLGAWLREFSAAGDKNVEELYWGEIIDLLIDKRDASVRIQKDGDTLILSLDGGSMAVRAVPAAAGILDSVKPGDCLRGICGGLKNGEIILVACRGVTVSDLDTAQLQGLSLNWGALTSIVYVPAPAAPPRDPPPSPRPAVAKKGGISSLAKTDSLSGLWEGSYAEEGGGESFRLRIDTQSTVELLDEEVEMRVAEAYVKDGLATVRAGWTDDDGMRREGFFTGPVRNNGWEGTVVVTGGADVLFQGAFTLKKR